MTLSDYIGDLRVNFQGCIDIVEQAGGNWANLQLNELNQEWREVQQNHVNRLQIFMRNNTDNILNDWFAPLVLQSNTVDSALQRGAIRALAEGIIAFKDQLLEFENLVSEHLKQNIKDLVILSNRTLGRLEIAS
jgi:hypothetical protein